MGVQAEERVPERGLIFNPCLPVLRDGLFGTAGDEALQ